MSTLNQEAPPMEAPKAGKDFIKFEPFPSSDTYVLTIAGYNYIASYPFKRKDDKTKEEYIKEGPAVELVFGTIIDGKAYFAKTFPQTYSLSDRANYYKWYKAATGKAPAEGSKPNDILGKGLLVAVEVEDRKSARGTAYKVNKVGTISSVPSVLAKTVVSLDALRPELEKALAANNKDGDQPF